MRYIILLALLFNITIASSLNIKSFDADFKQIVTNDKSEKLIYSGHIKATSPQYALWRYIKPIDKTIYIQPNRITIVEPEIEQVIIKNLASDFDFFKIIKNAKKIAKNKYVALVQESKYTITIKKNRINSISYKDEFDNFVEILFKNQLQNGVIEKNVFTPLIPEDYDIIEE